MSKTNGGNFDLQEYDIFISGDVPQGYIDTITSKQYMYQQLNIKPIEVDTSGTGREL